MAEMTSRVPVIRGPKPRTLGILLLLFVIFVLFWGSFVIVPAGHRGVVLWWGSVEKRIMGEGLNFKVPVAERVIKVDVKVQPHPFREIDAASKEYQMVRLTGMMNFHIDPSYVNLLYQTVGLDFANKVIDPAFNDFVKEVVPNYLITEILPKREEIRKRAMTKLGDNLARYHIIVDDIYIANIRFSPEYEKAIEAKQVAQQYVETQRQVLAQREIEAQQKVATAKGEAESIQVVAQGQAKANELLSRSISPILVEYKSIEKWNGIMPQVTGGALPFIELPKMESPTTEGRKKER
ncbi:MAG: rane protease subunit, stomatin/prohibitin [Deltaproteobacteria bacterium]|jgi:regulator of protease activity HflC (stomatin/prohibitin superfamily)|nr:rane protease subunit, stomatin/prohibitin [Deltaproteobacteria bacterium]